MEYIDYIDCLFLYSKLKKTFELRISGTSMKPILHEGDTITVCRKDKYMIGDIIVFLYKNNNLLVHRLLKIQNGRYFCKGDNSFRLEDIYIEHIVGAVILEFDRNNTFEFIADSLKISKLFRMNRYNSDITMASPEYIEYKQKYLE